MSRRTYLSTVLSTPMRDHCGCAGSMFLECAADGEFTTLPIKFTIQTIEWSGYEKVCYIYQTNKYFAG